MRAILTKLFLFILALFFPIENFAQEHEFNADSALANLEYLAVEIGPRPMGSANERKALQWCVNRFNAFGADTAYVMPVTHTRSTSNVINTSSGVAVGIFPGTSDSIIVIGGHIDSAPRESPGANDDASGVAAVLELARLWSTQPRHYTLVFAAFGGEERGLVGSYWFVDHFEKISQVALMLQIDMAASEGPAIPFFDAKSHQAPRWLVQDAYAIDRALGYNRLDYPIHFFTINTALGVAASSDHQPFLEKDIPAIDFTTGVTTSPIHTVNDRFDFIDKDALGRNGNFVDALMKKYDRHGIPSERKDHYLFWQAFGGTLFIPNWVIIAVNVLALALSGFAFRRAYRQRLQSDEAQKIKLSGTKIFAMMIIIAIFTLLGEAGMQVLRKLRYPWFVPFDEYMILAAIMAAAGVWVALLLTRVWRFDPDPYIYLKRALILLIIFVLLFAIRNARLALYPALTLLGVSLAVYLPGAFLKALVTLLAPLPMFRLMFNDIIVFGARSLPSGMKAVEGFGPAFLYSAILAFILVIWFLPSLYAFAYTYTRERSSLSFLRHLRHPFVGLVILLAIFGYGGYLSALPAYNKMWRATMQVSASYNMNSKEGKVELFGDEFFREVEVHTDSFVRSYDHAIHRDELPLDFTADWFSVFGTTTSDSSDTQRVHLDWQLATQQPWYEVTVRLETDTLDLEVIDSEWKYSKKKNGVAFRWAADPPETLALKAQLELPAGSKLIRTVEAVYPIAPLPIEVITKYADVTYRTRVTQRDTMKVTANHLIELTTGESE